MVSRASSVDITKLTEQGNIGEPLTFLSPRRQPPHAGDDGSLERA